MKRTEALEAILQLLPSVPESNTAPARVRLEKLSSGELQRMAEYLVSLIERRPTDNAKRKKWDEAQAHVRDLTSIQPLLAELEIHNKRAGEWLAERRIQQNTPAVTRRVKDAEQTNSEESEAEDAWRSSLDLARAKIRSGRSGDLDLATLADELSKHAADISSSVRARAMKLADELRMRATDIEFDRRFDAIRALRADLLSNGSYNANYSAGALLDLFRILPWNWFRKCVVRLSQRFRQDTEAAFQDTKAVFTDHDRVLLGKFLAELCGENVPHLSLSDSKRDPDKLAVFIALVNTLWRVPMKYIPPAVQGNLVPLLDLGAKLLDKKVTDDNEGALVITRNQFLFFSQAIMRAYLLISRLAEIKGRDDQASRVGNLVFSFSAAERAGFLSTRASFLEPSMTTELDGCAAQINGEPDHYLSGITVNQENPPSNFDILLGAADILRFKAHIAWRFSDRGEQASRDLNLAQLYYNRAGESADDQKKLRLFVTRAARERLLRAAMARKNGEVETAAKILRETVSWIDYKVTEKVDEGVLYLRCCALVAEAQSSILTPELDSAVIKGLRELITKNPAKPGGWNLLVDYSMNVKRDPDAAVELIAKWKASVEGNTQINKNLASSLAYRRAKLFFDMAILDRRRIEDAIRAYIDLLSDQPRNTVALGEFVDLMNRIDALTVSRLRLMVDEKFPDNSQLPWVHAILRAMFDCGPTHKSKDKIAMAFSDLMDQDTAGALEGFSDLLKAAPLADRVILELTSKYYFRRGRQERKNNDYDLAIADRLLQVGLRANPDDVVWISRRIDIALQKRSLNSASEMLDSARKAHPDDPILQFQSARLDLLQDKVGQAEATLHQLLPKAAIAGDGSAVDFHPAVVDQLALADLRQGRFDKAEDYYQMNLKRQPLDPRGWLGVGRVQFERGRVFWPRALESWGKALILQSDESAPSTQLFARRTAGLIAGLFSSDVNDSELIGSFETLLDKAPQVLNFLAPVLGSKRVPRDLTLKILATADTLNDMETNRRVAQFLRARTVYSSFSLNHDALLEEAAEQVEWCLKARVLSDYFAGAKGSYARALLQIHGTFSDFTDHGSSKGSSFSGPWKTLVDHVATDAPIPDYYATAEKLTAKISTEVPELAVFSVRLVAHVLETFKSKFGNPENLMDMVQPEIGLISPAELGFLDQQHPPTLSAWVDGDVYRVAQQFMNGEGWREAGAEIQRFVHRNPTGAQVFQFARGGIFFRAPTSPSQTLATAYLNVLPEWSRSTYEMETSGVAH